MSAGLTPDELVEYVRCYNRRPLLLHVYVFPFVVLYAIIGFHWLDQLAGRETVGRELFYLCAGASVVLHILCFLFCQWSIHVLCWFGYWYASNPEQAEFVKVVPTSNNGSTELRPLLRHRDVSQMQDKPVIWFVFQKTKYIYNHERQLFEPIQFPTQLTIDQYLTCRGYENDEKLRIAEQRFGLNDLQMDVPEFLELFRERAIAPFFVFQVFCMFLWCLEEYWYYSLFTLGMLVIFECFLVHQQLRNLTEIRKMGNNEPFPVHVYRNHKWTSVPSNQLIPGDVISIGRSYNNQMVPCDLLLLRGSLIADEAMLTGESVPQMKEPLELVDDQQRQLDFNVDGKLHVLFGGTKVLQHSGPAKGSNLSGSTLMIKPANNLCLAYVLKTSFSTSQGKLLRTILFGVKRVTANTKETFFFIMFLLVFAIASASYLWIEGTKDTRRDRYKLMVECILILTSVVPPELPIELSLAVNSSLLSLSKLYIYCIEPFRIPFAGKTEICCFDKTGTLTSDSLQFEGVAGVEKRHFKKTAAVSQISHETLQVLASCHSLVQLDEGMIGDPLEKATLAAIDWSLAKNDVVVPKKGKAPGMRILQRFHFSSALKRMSVIASYVLPITNETRYIATVKGAPEVVKQMLKNIPGQYDEAYLKISRKGGRVIALARKELDPKSIQDLKELKRDQVERDLEFAGFAVISCPLKADTKKVMREILDSSHSVMMITGDAPLTACYIATELEMFARTKKVIILCPADSEFGEEMFIWRFIKEKETLPVQPLNVDAFLKAFDLCVTGEGLDFLLEKHFNLYLKLLPHIKVWARVAPKQKEYILTSLRKCGYYTLMCGDGTNDVGALKHAHVGIALISNAPLQPPTNLSQRRVTAMQKLREMHEQSAQVSNHPKSPVAIDESDRYAAKLKKMMEEMDQQDNPMVKLGDASIAAPFTSRLGSIKCVCDVIKQGRCTLVTTLQMFKILALNALILAYCQSALYLDGIKFSDSQATLQGLLLAGCFLFISRSKVRVQFCLKFCCLSFMTANRFSFSSKPLNTLSKQRPLPTIFNAYSTMTVISQFVVHFSSLLFLVREAKLRMPSSDDPFVDLDAKFEPSILNSTVYIISIALQVSTFAVNYKGYPFMESLTENRSLLYSIMASMGVLFSVITGIAPELSDLFSIVSFEPDYQMTLLLVLVGDFVCAFLLDRFWQLLLGEGRLREELR